MSKQDNREADNQQSQIEDLPVDENQATEVKGGPIFPVYRGIDGEATDDKFRY